MGTSLEELCRQAPRGGASLVLPPQSSHVWQYLLIGVWLQHWFGKIMLSFGCGEDGLITPVLEPRKVK